MIYVIIGMGLFLMALGFVINVNNARYLLSGYNTMSEENRKKVDIHNLIPYLRKFQVFLGTSLIVIGLLLVWLLGEVAGGIFLAVYPILAYVYFIWDSRKFSQGLKHTWHWVSTISLAATLVFLGFLFFQGLREDRLVVAENLLILEGTYGGEFRARDIRNVSLVDNLPPIAMKTNGFALGAIRKGRFRTRDGEIVKLVLNSNQMPCVLITLTSGEKIYYTASDVQGEAIYDQIRGALPGVAGD